MVQKDVNLKQAQITGSLLAPKMAKGMQMENGNFFFLILFHLFLTPAWGYAKRYERSLQFRTNSELIESVNSRGIE